MLLITSGVIMSKLRCLSYLVAALVSACGADATREEDFGRLTAALAPAGRHAHFIGTSNLPGSLFPGERRPGRTTRQKIGASSPPNDRPTTFRPFPADSH